MDKYSVMLLSQAQQDIEDIYSYRIHKTQDLYAVNRLLDELEEALISLEQFLMRSAKRRVGMYAMKEYRQIFVQNLIIVYRIRDEAKQVLIVTVRPMRSSF